MRSLFVSRALCAAAPLVVLFVGCGIDAEGVGVSATQGGPGGTSTGGGRGGSTGSVSLAGRGGSEALGGVSGAGLGGAESAGASGVGGTDGEGGGGAGGDGGGAGGSAGSSAMGGVGGAGGADGGAGGAVGGAGLGGTAGNGGTAGLGGSAGSTTTGGKAGSAGSVAAGAGGAAGASAGAGGIGGANAGSGGAAGVAGAAGQSGSGGSAGQGPELCGNGRIDGNEKCDDGSGPTGSAACKGCQVPCDGGGFSANGHCYFKMDGLPLADDKLVGDLRAQRAGKLGVMCTAEGGHIASLGASNENTPAFLDSLGGHFATSTATQLLVGLVLDDDKKTASNMAKDWIWLDGTSAEGAPWVGGNPDGGGPACGTLMERGLNDLTCTDDALAGYLCEREPQCAVKSMVDSKEHLGFLGADNHCWVALPTAVKWGEAIGACTALRFLDGTGVGTIAVFTTKARLDALPGIGLLGTWVGASQIFVGKEDNADKKKIGWTWLTGGEAYVGLENMWGKDQPNGPGEVEDSAWLTDMRLLDDEDPNKTKRPLCEITP